MSNCFVLVWNILHSFISLTDVDFDLVSTRILQISKTRNLLYLKPQSERQPGKCKPADGGPRHNRQDHGGRVRVRWFEISSPRNVVHVFNFNEVNAPPPHVNTSVKPSEQWENLLWVYFKVLISFPNWHPLSKQFALVYGANFECLTQNHRTMVLTRFRFRPASISILFTAVLQLLRATNK